METVDENPNDTCTPKQWMLFSEATREDTTTTAPLKTEEEMASENVQEDQVDQIERF